MCCQTLHRVRHNTVACRAAAISLLAQAIVSRCNTARHGQLTRLLDSACVSSAFRFPVCCFTDPTTLFATEAACSLLCSRWSAAADCSLGQTKQHAWPTTTTVNTPVVIVYQWPACVQTTVVAIALSCSSEDVGEPIDTILGPGLQLMHQHLSVGSRKLTLVVPRDVNAVLDMYISRGDCTCSKLF